MISDNLNIPTHNNQKSIRIQGHEYKYILVELSLIS